MLPTGFESAVPASDRPQILALDCSATGIGALRSVSEFKCRNLQDAGIQKSSFIRCYCAGMMVGGWAGLIAQDCVTRDD